MSGKNFMSYGDADTILTEFSNDIKSRVSTKANQGLTAQQIANAKANIDIDKVPNVATNDQTPTFLEESTRTNIASGDKLSLIFGKIKKFFSDLKTVAFSGSYNDLSDTPTLVECSTARNVAAKTVTLPGFKLKTGARISVRFTDTSSSNPASGHITLNVNGTGAKEIVDGHANMTKVTYTYGWIFNGNLVNDFIYDGTYWVWINRDNNTTYSAMSTSELTTGTATTARSVRADYLKAGINSLIDAKIAGKADKTDINDVYSVMGEMGAKNLIPYPYPKMSNTVRGITWSDNGDGGIVGNGTGTEASSQPYCELNGNSTNNAKDLLLKANTWYTLTCKRTSPYAIGANIYFLDPTTMQQTSITYDVIYGDSAQTTATKNNVFMYNAGVVSEEVKFKLPQDMYAQVQVRYKSGTDVTVSNDVQYPMLRLASDTDDTYVPYAMTNKQLTDKLEKCWKLYAGTVIPDNSDLNDYKTPGNYYHLTTNVSTVSNIPDNKGFRLTVLLDLYDPAYVEQIFNPIGSYKTYKRYYSTSNTWTDWKVVEDDLSGKANTSDIPSALSDLTDDSTHRVVTDTEKNTWNDKVNKKTTVDSYYGTSSTAAATAAKVITVTDGGGNFSLRAGIAIMVKFSAVNTAKNPTFNVNNTGAKPVFYNTAVVTTGNLWAGGNTRPARYVYDGTNWVWMGQAIDSNTTYSAMSKAELTTGTATTLRTVRADYLKAGIEELIDGKLPTVPTKLSELTDDSTHRVVTDTEKSTWNGKSNFSGSYNDLTNKPTIPDVIVESKYTSIRDIEANRTAYVTISTKKEGYATLGIVGVYFSNSPVNGVAISHYRISNRGANGEQAVVVVSNNTSSKIYPGGGIFVDVLYKKS